MSTTIYSTIAHSAAGLHTPEPTTTVSSPSSSTISRGLKRAREEDEWSEDDMGYEGEDKGFSMKRRKVVDLPSPSSWGPGKYVGPGFGLPSNVTPRITRRAGALQSSYPVSPYKSPRHPVWKTESALRGLPSPILPASPPASDSVLPPFLSLLGGDFSHYPLSGPGVGLGITVNLNPLILEPDEMEV